MKKKVFITILFLTHIVSHAQNNDSISIHIIQPDVYTVKDEWFQQLNFDFSIENKMSETIELDELELYVYDKYDNIV
ncbi:MAG TPA: hypothetical protein DIT04_02855, partial [Dysgonomonas sp.]|nr:hypothetical protein [Dysgonomonas sp.]